MSAQRPIEKSPEDPRRDRISGEEMRKLALESDLDENKRAEEGRTWLDKFFRENGTPVKKAA